MLDPRTTTPQQEEDRHALRPALDNRDRRAIPADPTWAQHGDRERAEHARGRRRREAGLTERTCDRERDVSQSWYVVVSQLPSSRLPNRPCAWTNALTPPSSLPLLRSVLRIRPSTGQDHAANVPQRFQRTVVAPLNPTTLQVDGQAALHAAAGASTSLTKPAAGAGAGSKNLFTFDRVIGPDEGQADVYPEAEPLVEAFLDGMNATILAYGQTSSGKSYTMGTDRTNADDDAAGDDRLGITPRAVRAIFDRMRDVQRETRAATSYEAKLSYVEIYNEDLIDLLAGEGDARPTVQIREDKQGNIIWSGLREVKVYSAADVMKFVPVSIAE